MRENYDWLLTLEVVVSQIYHSNTPFVISGNTGPVADVVVFRPAVTFLPRFSTGGLEQTKQDLTIRHDRSCPRFVRNWKNGCKILSRLYTNTRYVLKQSKLCLTETQDYTYEESCAAKCHGLNREYAAARHRLRWCHTQKTDTNAINAGS